MGYEAVDFYVKSTATGNAPVAGVVVKVLSENGALVYGQQTTDADGKASFFWPKESPYRPPFYKFSWRFAPPKLFQPVDGGPTVFDPAPPSVEPPVPTDDRLCTAYGF